MDRSTGQELRRAVSPRIVQELEPRHRELWGRRPLLLKHTLAESPLFTDEVLAELIEAAPPRNLAIHGEGGEDASSWPVVSRGDASGADVLAATRSGTLWINLVGVAEWDSRYAALCDEIFAELTEQLPGFDVIKRKLGVLVSSPKATVHYHVDVPGQAIWQVRGRKRFIVYPNTAPFLDPVELEDAVRAASYGLATFQPWFDEHAEPFDLEPGDMLHWPLNGPHRVENGDELSVSLTSEHWTAGIRRTYAMNYGNGLLRHYGWRPRSRAVSGPAFWAKVGLTAGYRKSGLQNKKGYQRVATMAVDPTTQSGARPLPESEWAPPGQ
jgi:hypothetical protein